MSTSSSTQEAPSNHELAAQIAQGERADLDNALGVLRERVDLEFHRTERLDNKSRQAFALAAGFFALTQAAAFASFGENAVSADERVGILLVAVAAGAVLAFTAIRLYHAEKPRDEGSVPIESILDWCCNLREEKLVTAWLILVHQQVATERSESNAVRVTESEAVRTVASLSLALCGAELVIALAVRM